VETLVDRKVVSQVNRQHLVDHRAETLKDLRVVSQVNLQHLMDHKVETSVDHKVDQPLEAVLHLLPERHLPHL
jgi:hypothetical protein